MNCISRRLEILPGPPSSVHCLRFLSPQMLPPVPAQGSRLLLLILTPLKISAYKPQDASKTKKTLSATCSTNHIFSICSFDFSNYSYVLIEFHSVEFEVSQKEPVKENLREVNSQSESSDVDVPEEIVQADFAFFDPKPDDFHGVKILLQNYLDDKQWDLSGFVDLILAQTTVGTVVKIEDDEDDALFVLLTTLNLGRYKDHKSMIELKRYLLKVCQESVIARDL